MNILADLLQISYVFAPVFPDRTPKPLRRDSLEGGRGGEEQSLQGSLLGLNGTFPGNHDSKGSYYLLPRATFSLLLPSPLFFVLHIFVSPLRACHGIFYTIGTTLLYPIGDLARNFRHNVCYIQPFSFPSYVAGFFFFFKRVYFFFPRKRGE